MKILTKKGKIDGQVYLVKIYRMPYESKVLLKLPVRPTALIWLYQVLDVTLGTFIPIPNQEISLSWRRYL